MLEAGSLLNERYRVLARLGRGGQARTYAGETLDGTAVVIKELRFEQLSDWKPYELFQREVQVLKSLQHPAIPRVIDNFELGEGPERRLYLVLERMPGESLAEKIAAGWRPDEATVRQLALQALDVLAYLHGLAPPVLHRDIKPANLILDGDRLSLVDFGAVQDALRPEAGSTVVGTFGYMAPEQMLGRAVPASDLYALAATLVHLLAGRPPAELPTRELRLDLRGSLSCSPELLAWLERLLEPAWERRFASAAEARAALLAPALPAAPLPERTPRPSGSRIELLRTGQTLYIRIPPGNFSAQTIYMTFFTTVWLSFVAFWTLLASRGSVIFALFSLPFWLVGLGMAYTVSRSLFLSTVLELGPEGYRLQQRLAGLYTSSQEGPLADIGGIESSERYRLNHRPVFALGLNTGVRTHYFGASLSRSEQYWLQAELLEYLAHYLPPAQYRRLLAAQQSELPSDLHW